VVFDDGGHSGAPERSRRSEDESMRDAPYHRGRLSRRGDDARLSETSHCRQL